MNKDLVIGLVGTAILIAAMVGVFRFEAAQASSQYDIAWPTNTRDGPAADGRLAEGEEAPVDLNVTARNVTRIEFTLSWTDDVAQSAPDTFELRVTGPNGVNYTAQPSSSGTVTIVADDLALVPTPIRVSGSSAEDAEEELAPRYRSTTATGIWRATVVMVSAGETTSPVGEVPVPQDNGNEWALTTRITTYEATASQA